MSSPVQRVGFSLAELMITLSVSSVLAALLIPAIQMCREASRRCNCESNIRQVATALQNYQMAYQCFPPGTNNPRGPIINRPQGGHQSWISQILPFLAERNAYRRIDFSQSVYAPGNAPVRRLPIMVLQCPSESQTGIGDNFSSYAGSHHDVESPIDVDNHGVLFLNSCIRDADLVDGVSHTLVIGEKRTEPGDLGWMSGTRATLRNTGIVINSKASPTVPLLPAGRMLNPTLPAFVGGFGSRHPAGANFAYADGSVHFISEGSNPAIFSRLGHRADGDLDQYFP